jgi:NTE family protein
MLEALDELGVRPRMIAGSSIGAIIGALYASGMSGGEIRELIAGFIVSSDESMIQALVDEDAWRWIDFVQLDLGEGGLLSSEGFLSFLYDELPVHTFEALEIPLKVVAADLWQREQVVLASGELEPAIQASMALPGVFKPVKRDGRLLVDGGTVNPVPYDLLLDSCDLVIGVDVIGQRTPPESLVPSYFETVFNAVKVMQHAIMTNKRRYRPPDIYIVPEIRDIRALEFLRAEAVFEQAKPAKAELKRRLRDAMSSASAEQAPHG